MAKGSKRVKKRRLFGELMAGAQAMREHRQGRLTLRTHQVEPIALPALEPETVRDTREALHMSRRVFAFKLSRDVSGRVFPQTGVTTGFHNASHHAERPDRILDFAKINTYHVSLVPYFLERLKKMPDGEGSLLDNSLIVYGSPMGNPNVHNHKRCPLFVAGKAGGQIKGGLHIKAADGTPMANVFLTMAHMLGMNDLSSFGDSTGEFDMNLVAPAASA